MAPTIRIDDDVWAWLKSHARPLEDTPNSVLRRVAGLESAADADPSATNRVVRRRAGINVVYTPQAAFRDPILGLLLKNGGRLDRRRALAELHKSLSAQLTEADCSDIDSGTVRWQKNAEWQVHTMRRDGLLEPVEKSGNGIWSLTEQGRDLATKAANGGAPLPISDVR